MESVFKTFSLKGYLIIAFMITLGITMKYIPGLPESFFAWFHTGLGAGLLSAGIRFLIRWWKARQKLSAVLLLPVSLPDIIKGIIIELGCSMIRPAWCVRHLVQSK